MLIVNMDLSIIIPCYNSGYYLKDAIESVLCSKNLNHYRYEIIIINDGSTDTATINLLAAIEGENCIVLHQENAGPAAARNYGIKYATGRYLLFLDSDNKLRPHFIEKGISLLDSGNEDIVYGKPGFFGASTSPRFITGPFNINKIMVQNYIDICCIMRREVCTGINGFDEEKRIIGFEDWDLYIRAYAAGFKFLFVDEEVYDYRIVPGSLSNRHSEEDIRTAYTYIHAKHAWLVSQVLSWYLCEYRTYQFDRERPLRSCLKYFYKKYTGQKQAF